MKPFACPKCGGREFMVEETARDEDGYPVRLRKCLARGCDGEFATEEVPIDRGSFWQRAHSRNLARQERERGHPRRCHKCGGGYTSGWYLKHVVLSPQHAAALKPPSNGSSREHVRRYQREYQRRKRDVA